MGPRVDHLLGCNRIQVDARSGTEQNVGSQPRLGLHESAADRARGNVLVHRVRLDVLVEVASDGIGELEALCTLKKRRAGIQLVISKAARCPMHAPLNRRCSPKRDIALLTASV